MKILITTIAAVLLVGCGESKQSVPTTETKPVEPVAKKPAQQSPQPQSSLATTYPRPAFHQAGEIARARGRANGVVGVRLVEKDAILC